MKAVLNTAAGLIGRRVGLHTRELMQGASVTFFVRVAGTGIAFAFNIVLASILGASGTGAFYLGMTALAVAGVIGRLGLDHTVVRFTSVSVSAADWPGLRGVYRNSLLLTCAASGLSALAMYASAPFLASAVFKQPQLDLPFRWLSLAVVPIGVLTHHSVTLRGMKRVGWSAALQPKGGGIILPGLALCGLAVSGPEIGVTEAATVYSAAAALAALASVAGWRVITRDVPNAAPAFSIIELLRSSFPLLWVSLTNLVTAWAPVVLLSIFGTTRDVGIFSIAFRTAALTSFVLLAVSSIAAPKFASLYAEGRTQELSDVVRSSTTLMALASLPVLAVLLLAPGPVLALFGEEFSSGGAGILRVLALGQFVNVATGSVSHLLMMSGRERLLRNAMFGSAAATLLLNSVLIPSWGLMGAAIATSFVLAAVNLCLVRLSRRHLGISPVPLPRMLRRARA